VGCPLLQGWVGRVCVCVLRLHVGRGAPGSCWRGEADRRQHMAAVRRLLPAGRVRDVDCTLHDRCLSAAVVHQGTMLSLFRPHPLQPASYPPADLPLAASPAGGCRLQRVHLCLRPDRVRQDPHHVRHQRGEHGRARHQLQGPGRPVCHQGRTHWRGGWGVRGRGGWHSRRQAFGQKLAGVAVAAGGRQC
jgi:hypothetical protein